MPNIFQKAVRTFDFSLILSDGSGSTAEVAARIDRNLTNSRLTGQEQKLDQKTKGQRQRDCFFWVWPIADRQRILKRPLEGAEID